MRQKARRQSSSQPAIAANTVQAEKNMSVGQPVGTWCAGVNHSQELNAWQISESSMHFPGSTHAVESPFSQGQGRCRGPARRRIHAKVGH